MSMLSLENQSILKDITDNFKKNLIRQIKEDTIRQSKRRNKVISLKNVSYVDGDGNIYEVKNVKLLTNPVFNLQELDLNFNDMQLNMKFELNELCIGCDWKNFTLFENGTLKVSLTNICVLSKIGIFTKMDSFIPTNFDIDYNDHKNLHFECVVQILEDNSVKKSETFSGNIIDLSPATYRIFKHELEEILLNALKKLVASIIVDHSITEMFLDEPDKIRQHSKNLISKCGTFFDKVLPLIFTTNCLISIISDELGQWELSMCLSEDELTLLIKEPMRSIEIGNIIRHSEDSSYYMEQSPSEFAVCDKEMDTKLEIYLTTLILNDLTLIFDQCKLMYVGGACEGRLDIKLESIKLLIKITVLNKATYSQKLSMKILGFGEISILHDLQCDENDDEILLRFRDSIEDKLRPFILGYIRQYSDILLEVFEINALKKFNNFCKS